MQIDLLHLICRSCMQTWRLRERQPARLHALGFTLTSANMPHSGAIVASKFRFVSWNCHAAVTVAQIRHFMSYSKSCPPVSYCKVSMLHLNARAGRKATTRRLYQMIGLNSVANDHLCQLAVMNLP